MQNRFTIFMIIEKLRVIHAKYHLSEGNVSALTKTAQLITKKWQQAVCKSSIESEVKVLEQNQYRIDIVDIENNSLSHCPIIGEHLTLNRLN